MTTRFPTRAAVALALAATLGQPALAQDEPAPDAAPDATAAPADAAPGEPAASDAVPADDAPAGEVADGAATDVEAPDADADAAEAVLDAIVGTPPPLPPAEEVAETPPPLPPQPDFYVEENGAQGGPYKLDALEALVASGALTADTLAWTAGQADWMPAGEVEALASLFEAPTAGRDLVATAIGQVRETTPAAEAPAADAPADPAAAVVGRWRQQGLVPIEGVGMGTADLTVEYRADGTFTAAGTVSVNMGGQPFVTGVDGSGTYTVTPDAAGLLAVNTVGNVVYSPAGMAPVSQPMNETATYEVVGDGQLRDVSDGAILTRS